MTEAEKKMKLEYAEKLISEYVKRELEALNK